MAGGSLHFLTSDVLQEICQCILCGSVLPEWGQCHGTAMGWSLPPCFLQCLWSSVILGQTQVLCSSPVRCHKMAPIYCVGLLGLPLRLSASSLQSLSRGHQRSITLNPRRKGESGSVCSWRSWSLDLRMHPPFILFFFLKYYHIVFNNSIYT